MGETDDAYCIQTHLTYTILLVALIVSVWMVVNVTGTIYFDKLVRSGQLSRCNYNLLLSSVIIGWVMPPLCPLNSYVSLSQLLLFLPFSSSCVCVF